MNIVDHLAVTAMAILHKHGYTTNFREGEAAMDKDWMHKRLIHTPDGGVKEVDIRPPAHVAPIGKTRPALDITKEMGELKEKALAAVVEAETSEFSHGYHIGIKVGQDMSLTLKVELVVVGWIFGLLTFAFVGALYGMRFA